jgi:RNA polymerase sigma-70 factor (ECF subfamily)
MDEMPTSQTNPARSRASASSGVSDELLMLAFSKGSSDAFTELFPRYKQPIFGFFRRRVAEPAHAEELTQETFIALLRAAARYEPRALFRTYLPAKRDSTECSLWVRRAVEKLDSIDREVLLLREFEELSYAEIADLLQLPLNTVRSRLFRARTSLRNLLEPLPTSAAQDAPQNIAKKGERA